MADDADPLDGWPLEEVLRTSSGPATADTYGKLYFHLRGVLGRFIKRISEANIVFEMHHADASSLPHRLENNQFSRIDVSTNSFPEFQPFHTRLHFSCETQREKPLYKSSYTERLNLGLQHVRYGLDGHSHNSPHNGAFAANALAESPRHSDYSLHECR